MVNVEMLISIATKEFDLIFQDFENRINNVQTMPTCNPYVHKQNLGNWQ